MAIGSLGYTSGSFYARWHARPSAYSQVTSWREKQSAHSQDFLANSSALSSAISSAMISYVQGMGTITGQMAMGRIQAAAKERLAALDKLA